MYAYEENSTLVYEKLFNSELNLFTFLSLLSWHYSLLEQIPSSLSLNQTINLHLRERHMMMERLKAQPIYLEINFRDAFILTILW